jgi:hypothetical protein
MTRLDPLRGRETLSAGDRDLDDRTLRAHLAALRRAHADDEAPAAVEQALLDAWDRIHRARTPRLPVRLAASAAAMAAAVVLGVALTVDRDGPRTPSGPAVADTPARDVVLPAAAAPPSRENPRPPFEGRGSPGARRAAAPGPASRAVVLVGSPITPGEPIHLVRMRVARETLLEMGLRPVSGTGDEPVDVEMLVGEDGVARGLRVTM